MYRGVKFYEAAVKATGGKLTREEVAAAMDHGKLDNGPGGPAEMVPGKMHCKMNMYVAVCRVEGGKTKYEAPRPAPTGPSAGPPPRRRSSRRPARHGYARTRLAFGCWLFGSLLSTLAVLCTQQRWPRVFGHNLLENLPEAEPAVGDGKLGSHGESAPLEIEEQFLPRLRCQPRHGTLTGSITDPPSGFMVVAA
jgi:hypothetical protein